jgi:hypothetical protein
MAALPALLSGRSDKSPTTPGTPLPIAISDFSGSICFSSKT